eukprot:350032-Chlamydomonas_euryale.AAC.3
MSDLALPFLLLVDDDAVAFWCFEHLMRRVRRNFAVEDSGIFAQLTRLAGLLEELDPPLYYKVGAYCCAQHATGLQRTQRPRLQAQGVGIHCMRVP